MQHLDSLILLEDADSGLEWDEDVAAEEREVDGSDDPLAREVRIAVGKMVIDVVGQEQRR